MDSHREVADVLREKPLKRIVESGEEKPTIERAEVVHDQDQRYVFLTIE